MLTAKLHVQVAVMVEWFQGNRFIVRKSEAFEEIKHSSDCKDVVNVDEGDEARERKIVELAVSRNACCSACVEVGDFERNNVAELSVDGANEARFWLRFTRAVFGD